KGIGKEVVRIENVVSEKFVGAPMNHIGSGTDCGIHRSAGTAAKLCRVRVRLNFEFLQRFNRRLDDLNVLASIGARIRNVIDPIEQKRIAEGAVPIHIDGTLEIQSSQSRGRWRDARCEKGELVVVSPVQRQFNYIEP